MMLLKERAITRSFFIFIILAKLPSVYRWSYDTSASDHQNLINPKKLKLLISHILLKKNLQE